MISKVFNSFGFHHIQRKKRELKALKEIWKPKDQGITRDCLLPREDQADC